MTLKLFQVTCWNNYQRKEDIFENFVIAGNDVEARRIIEEEVWTISGMEIKEVKEVDMSFPQLLCFVRTDDYD